ncbi:hypothetical protein TELCIR_02438, partial [Teladorsagia circumcincta]
LHWDFSFHFWSGGFFQLFVKGYESAQTVFSRWDYDKSLLSESEEERFKYLFQKMIVLDYIIRNTDRHMDNLLIRHVPGKVIELAAIDNGLAFPVKHPECVSRFRTFPFRWTEYRWAQQVRLFSDALNLALQLAQ